MKGELRTAYIIYDIFFLRDKIGEYHT